LLIFGQFRIKNDLYFGLKGYTFTFGPRRDVDAKTQMEGDTEYAKNAILTVDEIREELGKEPLKDVKEASMPGVMTPNNGFIPLSIDAAQTVLSARQQTNTPPEVNNLKPLVMSEMCVGPNQAKTVPQVANFAPINPIN
jgi:hypothetical protein